MKKIFVVTAILSLPVYYSHCQDLAHLPAFDVASITPCKPGTAEPGDERMGLVRFTFPGGRFEARATSLKFLLEWAYGILPSQHSDGPSWMGDDRYDIVAKAGGNATNEQMRLMTRTLLAERFHLRFHRVTMEVPLIVISLGRTAPRLFRPKEGEEYSIRMEPQMTADKKVGSWHVVATRFSFAQLNETFSRQLERVIVNQTGMDGDFDFALDLPFDENQPNPLDAAMIIKALRDQLGLAVQLQKGPVEYLAIDGAEKATGN